MSNQNAVHLKVDHCRVWVETCPPRVWRFLFELLSYQEKASYYQRVVRGLPPVWRRLFDVRTGQFPKGLLTRVVTALEAQGYAVTVTQLLTQPPLRPYEVPAWAYPHQRRAVAHLLAHPHSSLQSPTGSGKTAIGAFLLGHISGRALMIVPTKDLLFQSARKIEEILGEPVGLIGGGQCTWRRLNVGIINSLVKVKEAQEVGEIEACIYDEAHRAVQFSRYGEFVQYLRRCYFHWGLTAGAHREDGAELALEAIIGPVLMVISEREVEQLQLTLKPRIFFVRQPDPCCDYPGKYTIVGRQRVYQTPNGKPELREVYRLAVVCNQERNKAIARIVAAYRRRHQAPVLVLVEGVDHGEMLAQQLGCPFIHGGSPRQERQANLEGLRKGEIGLTVATRVYNEGVDIPNLGMIINAAAGCSRQLTRQKVGRCVRSSAGKTQAIIVDFYDEEKYYLRRQAQRRLQTSEEIYPGSCKVVDLEVLCHELSGEATYPVGFSAGVTVDASAQ